MVSSARRCQEGPAPAARPRLVARAQAALAGVLGPGAVAVDATAGNGHDTLFLARAVGPAGRVYALDVQQAAVTATRARLAEAGLAERVHLVRAGHETLPAPVPAADRGRVAVVMFNLGYLPGGDHGLITRPQTTWAALEAAGALLAPGGRLSVLAYTGHRGGGEEAEAVRTWVAGLPAARFASDRSGGATDAAPRLWVIERRVAG